MTRKLSRPCHSLHSIKYLHRIAVLAAVFTAVSTTPLLNAQEGSATIRGRVMNAQTDRFVARAQVQVVDSSQRVFTNQLGEYELYRVPAGTVELLVTFTGMEPLRAVLTLTPGEVVERDFTFTRRRAGSEEEMIFELAEFVVTSSFQSSAELAIQAERYSPNLKNVVDTGAFGLTAQGNVGEFVKFIPGVTIGYGGDGAAGGNYSSPAEANTISIRGFSARETVVTIDGISIANAAPGTLDPAFGLDMLSINNASRIEVVKVPTPDQPNAGIGGTVNLISKSAFEFPKPTLNYRVYLGMNSDNLKIFSKTPGPMNKPTYKARPSFDMTYAVPLRDDFGFTITLASANQVNEQNVLKARITRDPENPAARPASRTPFQEISSGGQRYHYWMQNDPRFPQWQQQYGDDWTQWTEENFSEMYNNLTEPLRLVKRLPRYDSQGNLVGAWSVADRDNYEQNNGLFYDAAGNPVGRVYPDWAHPFMHRIQVTDSPTLSQRNSAAVKLDWRPFTGLMVSANYQVSTFDTQAAGRRIHQIGGRPFEYGPDYSYSRNGGVRLDTDAFSREGITHSGYLRANYKRGPWEIGGHISYAKSSSDILSIEKGHFSVVQLTLGGVALTEYIGIDRYGAPQQINYYRNVTDGAGTVVGQEPININTLESYNIQGFDPNNSQAGQLRVRSAGINSNSEVTTAKLDVRRELDFLKLGNASLAVKIGIDWEERKEQKGGRGINYEYVYTGLEPSAPISALDIRDNRYIGVNPGFGMQPIEWPDPFALYQYMRNNPEAFSDTDDRVAGTGSRSAAHQNFRESVFTTKGITETKVGYYAQLEGNFINNRLTVIGGVRSNRNKRSGYDRAINNLWNFLHFDRDLDGNGIRDVFRNYTTPDGIVLGTFDVIQPIDLFRELRAERKSTFAELSPAAQARVMTVFNRYEQAGAVYADGTPFIASEFEPLNPGELRAAQYQYIKAFPIREKAQSQPRPMISASYDLTENLVLRAAWSITYSNPPYESSSDVVGTLREIQFNENDDGTGSMTVSNPSLKVAKTQGWDLGLFYYTDSGGQFGISGYYKEENDRPLTTILTPSTTPEAWQRIMADLGFGPGHPYHEKEWTVNTSRNAAGTYVDYGFELEARQSLAILPFLGSWGQYFFVYASYIEMFQKAGSVPPEEAGVFVVPAGLEKRINASGGVNFNYKRLNLHVNATWRNARLHRDNAISEVIFWDDATLGNPGWYTPETDDDSNDAYLKRVRLVRPADLRIDFSGSIRITDKLFFDFSARNITQSNPEPVFVREDGGSLGPTLYANVHDGSDKIKFGINFTLGLSGTF